LPYAVHAMVPNLWFANLLKFGKVFQGVRWKMSAMAYFVFAVW
jgi:hypothetical protein